jgi:hypothetical protein
LDRQHDRLIERQYVIHEEQLGAETKPHRSGLDRERGKVSGDLTDGIRCGQ